MELYKTLEKPGEGKTFADTLIKAEEFEKDEDSNFHIDFMAAMGNCPTVRVVQYFITFYPILSLYLMTIQSKRLLCIIYYVNMRFLEQ